VVTKRQQRGLAVAAYDQLPSGAAKRDHVKAAQQRISQGKATEGDKAVVHIHQTRVEGRQKVAQAQHAFDALNPENTVAKLLERAKPKPTTRETTGTLSTAILNPTSVAGAISAIGAASAAGLKMAHVPKIAQNVPKDVAELAVTTPSSLAKLATTTVTHPQKVPGMLAAPYVELAKHPEKFVTEHPVSAALMLAPAARIPGRAVGRVARVAGKQTLERPAATLAGTTLKEARTGSRGVVTRAVQARRDASKGSPSMTQAQVQRRVDEFYDFGKQHKERVVLSATREMKRRSADLDISKDTRRQLVQDHVSGARGGADHQVNRRFVHEFGAPAEANAKHGHVFESHTDADAAAQHLNAQSLTVARGAHGPHQAARAGTHVPLEFKVVDAGYGKFGVVPKVAAERLAKHKVVGSSGAIGAKVMRTAGRSFRGAVLPLSARWLFGQVGEAGFRAGVAGAGPADLIRVNRVVKAMNKAKPGSGDEFLARVHGGQFDMTGTAREFADGRSLADEFKGTAFEDVAHATTKAANTRPAKAIRSGWGKYTNVVFNVVNGTIETAARKAMAGQAIRQGPLMEGRLVGLTDKAIRDAARGLQGTEAQVQAARAVDRMYGQYQKFSPEKRETLLHSTPFYPWYRNTVTFLTQTLPVDHPVKAALVADLDAATEDWRKAHGLSLRESGGKPGFLLGTYPVGKEGQTVPAGRYLPFVPGQPLQSVADLFGPQFAGVKGILSGVDWKGQKLKTKQIPGELAKSVIEAHVPGAGQIGGVTGLSARYLEGKKDEPTVFSGKKLGPALAHQFAPFPKTKVKPKKHEGKTKKKSGGGFAGFGSGSSGFAGF
jgi:hypothetical protein